MKKALLIITLATLAVGNVAFAEDPPTIVWNKVYDSGNADVAWGVAVDGEANVYVTGSSHNGTDWDYLILKYEQHTAIAEQPPTNSPLILEVVENLSATPTLSYTLPAGMTGTLTFYSADGRAIESHSLNPSQSSFTWPADEIPAGVYFAELTVGNYAQTVKAILIR